ncbi:unnamed protein product, partial [marine sediment metagenome]
MWLSLAGLKITKLHYLEEVLIKKSNTWNEWLAPPQEIAESFIGKTPLFIGARHLAPVAYRAKCQINENSKALAEGNVRITFMGAEVTLNNDSLSYTPFTSVPLVADQYLYPEFNRNYTLHNSATTSVDRQTILDADTEDNWNWDIEFRYSF